MSDSYTSVKNEPAPSSTAEIDTPSTEKCITFDFGYLTTFFGKLNIAQTVVNLICFISAVAQPTKISPRPWYLFVCVKGLISSIIEIVLSIINIKGQILHRKILLRLVIGIFSAIWALFYIAAASAAVHYARKSDYFRGWYAAGIFGFLAVLVYGSVAVYRLQDWWIAHSAQKRGTNASA